MKTFLLTIVATGIAVQLAAQAQDAGPQASGHLKAPLAMAIGKEGTVLVVDGTTIVRYSREGKRLPNLTPPDFPATPINITVDSAKNVYFAAFNNNWSGYSLWRAVPEGASYKFEQLVKEIWGGLAGIAVDKIGQIYVADGNSGAILRFDQKGTQLPDVATSLGWPENLAVNKDDILYFTTKDNKKIWKATPKAGNSGVIYEIEAFGDNSVKDPGGITIDSDQNVYVADRNAGMVHKYDRSGKKLAVFHGLEESQAVAVDGEKLYIMTAKRVLARELSSGRYYGYKSLDLEDEGDRKLVCDKQGNCFLTGNGISKYDLSGSSGALVDKLVIDDKFSEFILDGLAIRDSGELAFGLFLPRGAREGTFGKATPSSNGKYMDPKMTYLDDRGIKKVAFGPNGTLFYSFAPSGGGWGVRKYSSIVLHIAIIERGSNLEDLAVDGSGNVYMRVSNGSKVSIYKAAPRGDGFEINKEFITGIVGTGGIFVNEKGDLYVVERDNDGSGCVRKYNENGEFRDLIATGLNEPRHVAVDGKGDFYILCAPGRLSGKYSLWKFPNAFIE